MCMYVHYQSYRLSRGHWVITGNRVVPLGGANAGAQKQVKQFLLNWPCTWAHDAVVQERTFQPAHDLVD